MFDWLLLATSGGRAPKAKAREDLEHERQRARELRRMRDAKDFVRRMHL